MAEIYGLRVKGANSPIYIGSTKYTASYRFKSHVRKLWAGNHPNKPLQQLVSVIGIQNLEPYLIECVSGDPRRREYELINQYRLRGVALLNRILTVSHNAPHTDPLSPFILTRSIILALTAPERCKTPRNQRLYSSLRRVARKYVISLLKDNGPEVLSILRSADAS